MMSIPARRRTGSNRPRADINARSAQDMRGRAACRFSTANW
ncbi:hypothetical protein [Actinoallomurus purpureus]|nr:hypothetical protein [Actinoallomurus purpureus]